MITKITKDNKDLYRQLFQIANESLGLSDEDAITSIEEYFSYYGDMLSINKPILSILPLDEPVFEIDANSRTINIPAEFKKNGISVKGDQAAEVLYFTIDRFYDNVDLYDQDHGMRIGIEWEGAPDAGSKTVIRKISHPTIIDLTTLQDKGKIIFNWVLNDEITKVAGTIKFAVRFYKIGTDPNGNPALTYSFSTLTHTAVINNSLDYQYDGEWDNEEMNDGWLMIDRFNNSPLSVITDAEPPRFLHEMPEEDILDLIDGSYSFAVSATSDDAGVITYTYYRKSLGAQEDELGSILETTVTKLPTLDEEYEAEHKYFKIVNGEYVPVDVRAADAEESDEYVRIGDSIDPEDDIYEEFAVATTNRTGIYYVKVQNRVGKTGFNTIQSELYTIPGPVDPIITNPYPDAQEGQPEGAYTSIILDSETGVGTLPLQATAAQTYYDTPDQLVYEFCEGSAFNPEGVVVGEADGIHEVEVPSESRALYDQLFTGTVFARRNGDDSARKDRLYRVTDAAHQPVLTLADGDELNNELVVPKHFGANTEVTCQVNINVSEMVHDEVSAIWYKLDATTPDPEDAIALNDEPVIITINNGLGVASIVADESLIGQIIYCVVKNEVNGTTNTIQSEKFSLLA